MSRASRIASHQNNGQGGQASFKNTIDCNQEDNVTFKNHAAPNQNGGDQNNKKLNDMMKYLSDDLEKEQVECGHRFKLQKKIGEGTYGVVYKAFDNKLDKVSIISFHYVCFHQPFITLTSSITMLQSLAQNLKINGLE